MPPAKGKKYRPRKHPELAQMEAVEKQEASKDTPHQEKLRAWYDSDIKGWTARKDRLRGSYDGPEESGEAIAAVAPEVLPEEPVEVLIQRLIDEGKKGL